MSVAPWQAQMSFASKKPHVSRRLRKILKRESGFKGNPTGELNCNLSASAASEIWSPAGTAAFSAGWSDEVAEPRVKQ